MGFRALTAALCLLAAAPAAAQESRHSVQISGLQARYAPLVRAAGRDLVIFDADGLVRPFGDAVLGRTWDKVPKGARGSFERISEATGERRAFSMIVRVGGKAQCRVGPTSPDQAAMNLFSAYSGQDPQALNPSAFKLSAQVFERFVLLHEIGHCTDPDAFARSADPIKNVMLRHRAEAYGDAFAILELAREGIPREMLDDIIRIRTLYMLASASGSTDRGDLAILKREHVPYWNIVAMRSAIASAGRIVGAEDRTVAALAKAIVDNDGVTTAGLIAVHRALADEDGKQTNPVSDAVAYASTLLTPTGRQPKPASFDKSAWARDFDIRLRGAGASGRGPAALIAAERNRLRGLASADWNADDAAAYEGALARLSELATKGYAGISDPPITVSSGSRPGGLQPDVAAMPSRLDVPGPIPRSRMPDDAAFARMSPYVAAAPTHSRTASLPPEPKPAPPGRLQNDRVILEDLTGRSAVSPPPAARARDISPDEPARVRRY